MQFANTLPSSGTASAWHAWGILAEQQLVHESHLANACVEVPESLVFSQPFLFVRLGLAPEDDVCDQATEPTGNRCPHGCKPLRQSRLVVDDTISMADDVSHHALQLSVGHASDSLEAFLLYLS